ncbi:hypothetical protein BGZ49_001571 [Haplosporangium sp. Z 27]|nr:hypothetical protein BGZ49_001571 [Haplosporangium sp. Z 27]
MPSVTLNHTAARSQMYQEPVTEESTRQTLEMAQQYHQDLMDGIPNTTQSLEAIMMSIELEQPMELDLFTGASQGNRNNQTEQAQLDINQTQLLTGARP